MGVRQVLGEVSTLGAALNSAKGALAVVHLPARGGTSRALIGEMSSGALLYSLAIDGDDTKIMFQIV